MALEAGVAGLVALALTAYFAYVTSSRATFFVVAATAVLVVVAFRQREPAPGRIMTVLVAALAFSILLAGLRAVNQGQVASLGETTGPSTLASDLVGARE